MTFYVKVIEHRNESLNDIFRALATIITALGRESSQELTLLIQSKVLLKTPLL